ncbi:MAG: biotin transporter BioY [Acidimicrobiales bacterium]
MSTVAVPTRRVLADVVSPSRFADAGLVVAGATLTGLLAQISIPLGFTPVPLTGQTLGVMLAGAALGWRRATAALSLYVVAGILGVPWFAGHASGYPAATFGYLLGFIVAGAVLGRLAASGADRTVGRAIASMVAGELTIFAFGVTWLALDLHVSAAQALALGLSPFVAGELIKVGLCGIALPTTWRLVDRTPR